MVPVFAWLRLKGKRLGVLRVRGKGGCWARLTSSGDAPPEEGQTAKVPKEQVLTLMAPSSFWLILPIHS